MARRVLVSLGATAALLVLAGAAASTKQGSGTAVDRGRYLVTAMGCNDCHTPWKMGANGPEPDMSRLLSGHPQDLHLESPPVMPPASGWAVAGSATMTAWAGPWGISYAANLTPDEETGVGAWTPEVFVKAMRTGKMMGAGRPILPPMPWPWTGKLSDDDLRAIFAYLQSIPPIHNQVPEPTPPKVKP